MMLTTRKLRQTSADDGHISSFSEMAWDCGCHRHLKASSEGALMARVLYHLDAQHPEAHPTLEQVEELVIAEAYDEPS
jgi:hypothetical protein